MNYWLTIHWPLRVDEDDSVNWRNWVFLAEGWKGVGRDIRPGDRVFVYETESAPRVRKGKRLISRKPGRKGVVAVARVRTQLQDDADTKAEELEDGRVRCWRYRAKTTTEREGFLSLAELRRLLGKPGFSARIPGGLLRLSEEQFNRIFGRFG